MTATDHTETGQWLYYDPDQQQWTHRKPKAPGGIIRVVASEPFHLELMGAPAADGPEMIDMARPGAADRLRDLWPNVTTADSRLAERLRDPD